MPAHFNDKEERQYKHIKASQIKAGKDEAAAKQIAAATVNKQRGGKSISADPEEADLMKMKPRVKKALRQVKLLPEHRAKVVYAQANKQYGEEGDETAQTKTQPKPKLAAGTEKPPTKSSQAKTAVGKRMALQPMKPMKPNVSKANPGWVNGKPAPAAKPAPAPMSAPQVQKAMGEGSRGGDVIGHTRSGKPIYRRMDGMSPGEQAKAHPFTEEEHREAAKRHKTVYNKAKVKWHADVAAAHEEHAQRARNRDKGRKFKKMKPNIVNKKKVEKATTRPNLVKAGKGPGSRGGDVIGHTRSGKPVYGPTDKHVNTAAKHYEAKEEYRNTPHAYGTGAHKPIDHTRVDSWNEALNHAHGKHKDFTEQDHHEASQMLRDHAYRYEQAGEEHHAEALHHAAEGHRRMASRKNLKLEGAGQGWTKKSLEEYDLKKSEQTTIEKSTSKENDMSDENKLEDLFKSELGGDTEETLTHCVHCSEGLTKSDLTKGLSTHFIKDDNDQPHSGGKGSVPIARTGGGAKETDEVAPLLKGEEHGDDEEFHISKSEMDAMGMDVSDLEDGDHTITKGEMVRLGADQHVPYLRSKKVLSKSIDFTAGVQSAPLTPEAAPPVVNTTPEHAATPVAEIAKGGMAYGPGGGSLVQWVAGDDEAIAKSIELNELGQGNDEPIRGIQ